NSANVVFALEQGTLVQPGGPAHWTSYFYNLPQYGNQSNVNFSQSLLLPRNWPWMPGQTYYLAVTNTSAVPESFSFAMAIPPDLAPAVLLAATSVVSTRPNPQISVVWAVT